MASPLLARALKSAPEAVKKVLTELSEKAVKEAPKSTGAVVLDLPLMLAPPVKRQAARAAEAVASGARKADIAVGDRLTKIPLAGRAFRTTEDVALGTLPSGAALKASVPVGKASQPAMAVAKHVVTPILAFSGAEHLASEYQKAKSKELKMSSCGHEEILQRDEALLKEAADALEAKDKQIDTLLSKLAEMVQTRRAERVVDQFIERGLVSEGVRQQKVADYVSGKKKLSSAEELLSMDGPALVPSMGEVEKVQDFPGGDDQDEATEYLLGLSPKPVY